MNDELENIQAWLPARVQKLSLGSERELFFELYAGRKYPLCFSVGPTAWSLVFEKPATFQTPQRPGALQGQLRKELLGGSLVTLDYDEDKKSLTWTFQSPKGAKRTLVAEIQKKDPRLVFLHHKSDEDPGRILSVLSGTVKGKDGRDLRRGKAYLPVLQADIGLPFGETHHAPDGTGQTPDSPSNDELSILRRRLKSEAKRIDRLIQALQQDRHRHGEPQQMREAGEWLKTCLSSIQRGTKEFVYADSEGTQRSIRLDPQLDGPGNLEKLFKRAKRAEAGLQVILPKLQLANAHRDELQKWRDAISPQSFQAAATARRQDSSTSQEWNPAADMAAAQAFLSTLSLRPSPKRQALQQSKRKAWRAFACSEDVVIRVGRSAKDNDELTFHAARGNDLWMHTREVAGSHVIVPAPKGRETPWEIMLDAAHLAIWFSPLRGQARADVQFARKKYISKPGKGVAPGFVHVHQEKVLHVRFEDDRIQRLLASEVPP